MQNTEMKALKPLLTMDEVQCLANDLASLKEGVLNIVEQLRGREGVDQRWLQIGVTDFEKGLLFIGKELVEGPMNAAIGDDEAEGDQ